MGKIQILSPELINQIAAGEVVERPASVVKELVENAIDAGATRVEIQASDGGRHLRIADNGCGMEKADLEMAFRNHATSKVQKIEDLFDIRTLGFRGEALASIAAVSKVTCLSRTPEATTGLKAIVNSAGEVVLQETGCAIGTIFEIEELFYNVPARLKFLKRPQTELSHIQEMVQMLALSHPEIAFQLKLEASQSVKTSGAGQLSKAIEEVFALSETETLVSLELRDEEFGYRVWGETSTPNITRGSKKWVMTFVNGRAVKCPILSKAIESAYQSLMVPGKFPITVLFLELPPDEVDVNVHPTKKEVKYQRANTLFSFVRKAIDMAMASITLDKQSSPQETSAFNMSHFGRNKSFSNKPDASYARQQGFPEAQQNGVSVSEFQSRKPVSSQTVSTPQDAHAALNLYAPLRSNIGENLEKTDAFVALGPTFRVIGQLAQTYILVENADGLLVVDQHIASERVRFELFSEQAEKSEVAKQSLLVPIVFPVSAVQAATLDENRNAFESLGFQYTFTAQEIQFSAVPALYNSKVLKTSLEGLLFHLEETGEVKLSFDDVLATAACHSAVRAGDVLNAEQMKRIIEQWFQCQRPWTCPHGRPVSHTLSHQELMRFFERPSLPGSRESFTLSK